MSMTVSRYHAIVEKGNVCGRPATAPLNPGLPPPASGEAGAHRPVRVPCVLTGDSRGCGAGPQAHAGREVYTIIPGSSLGQASRSLDNFHRRGCKRNCMIVGLPRRESNPGLHGFCSSLLAFQH